jgi:hypothetical protein
LKLLHPPPFFHDGTERPIQRPKDPEEQQEYDRGKKKCHTLKNLLLINETCHVCFLSYTWEGKASDKSIAELAGYTLPPGSGLYQDQGFQGFFLPGITIVQPKKTPVGSKNPNACLSQRLWTHHRLLLALISLS